MMAPFFVFSYGGFMSAVSVSSKSAGQKTKTLLITVVHQDTASGLRANKFLDRTLGRTAHGPEYEKNFWTLDLLRSPTLQEQAALEAGHAAVILLSLAGHSRLPEFVRQWLSRWSRYRENRPYGFGVLLDGQLVGSGEANSDIAGMEKIINQETATTTYM